MRIIIDECLNWRLARALPGHDCTSVQRMGWSGIQNGSLLARICAEGFDVFLTGDRNLQFQQRLPIPGIAIVVLAARSTRLADTLPLMGAVRVALPSLKAGTITIFPLGA